MSQKTPVFLHGKKVGLRPVLKSDLPFLVCWINDPDVRNFLSTYLPQTEGAEEEWLSQMSKRDEHSITLVIALKDGTPIGMMGIHKINWRDRVATTGSFIGEKENWGKGYGTDAKMALLGYCFNTINIRKVCSEAIEFNGRSIAYSKKCGYEEEGRRKEHIFRNGRYWDLVQLAVFREGFEEAWSKYQEK